MSTTIAYAGGPTITPDHVTIESAAATSAPRTVSHDILDGPPVHTLRPAGPRTGRLVLAFTSERRASDCFEAHRLASVFTVASTVRDLLNLSYIVTGGSIEITLDRETAGHWLVTVPFQEVL